MCVFLNLPNSKNAIQLLNYLKAYTQASDE